MANFHDVIQTIWSCSKCKYKREQFYKTARHNEASWQDDDHYIQAKKKKKEKSGERFRRSHTADLSTPFKQQNTKQHFYLTCMLPLLWHFDFIVKGNVLNKYFFSPWLTEESFHLHQTDSHSVMNGLNCLVHSWFLAVEDIFGTLLWQTEWCTEREKRERLTGLSR